MLVWRGMLQQESEKYIYIRITELKVIILIQLIHDCLVTCMERSTTVQKSSKQLSKCAGVEIHSFIYCIHEEVWQNYYDIMVLCRQIAEDRLSLYKQVLDNVTAQSNILIITFNLLSGLDRIVKSIDGVKRMVVMMWFKNTERWRWQWW